MLNDLAAATGCQTSDWKLEKFIKNLHVPKYLIIRHHVTANDCYSLIFVILTDLEFRTL